MVLMVCSRHFLSLIPRFGLHSIFTNSGAMSIMSIFNLTENLKVMKLCHLKSVLLMKLKLKMTVTLKGWKNVSEKKLLSSINGQLRSHTLYRELVFMLSLAKVTMLWNWSVKIHFYMICSIVATSISGCSVCTVCAVVCDCSRTLHGTQYTHHSLKYLLPQHRKSYDDVFLLISFTIL